MRPEFTAVSYTWADSDGNRSLSEEIFLGDSWIPLPITPNCAAALNRLRSGHQAHTFWVDSICIDQLSTDEKSHQVRLMRDIFSRATSVTIFLGADEDTQDARLMKRTNDSLFYSSNQEDIQWDAPRDHMAVRALFDRPYWSRVWVVQEVLLSKKAIVVLGKTAVPLQLLLKARLLEHDGSTRLFNVPRWLQLGTALPIGDFQGLSKLLTETSTCLATDPKDMVFALLGLVQGSHLEGLVADYSKSIHEIRIGIAAYFLIRHGQSNILKSAVVVRWQSERLVPGSPSWVPSWDPDSHSKNIFADSIDAWCWTDLKRSTIIDDWARMLRCYSTMRPEDTNTTPLRHTRISASSFRVMKGTGALLVGAYPLLQIGPSPFGGAFKYRSVANRSALLIPSASVAQWGIYVARQQLDRDLEFGRPGDLIVEIPGCDDFFLLAEIPSLSGVYRISAVCGLAIAVSFVEVWLPDGELPQPTNGSFPPKLSADELISRLIIFDPHQLQFLADWEALAPHGTTFGLSSEKSDSSRAQLSTALSEKDIRQYIQWAERISENPLRATQPTSFEDTLKNVSIYLDQWQDLDLWNRIVSELEAVSWASLLEALVEIKSGLMPEHPAEDEVAGIKHDQSLRAAETLRALTAKLRNLLLVELTSRGTSLQPAGTMDALGPLLQAVDEADTSTILEVFKARQDEIEKNLKKLESHFDFMRDSLHNCYGIRDKFSQRHLLKHLNRRSELRNFLLY